MGELAGLIAAQIKTWRSGWAGPLVVGLCGPQGSGKSTAVTKLAALLGADGLTLAILSLDDLVLPRAGRADLAHDIHPLFVTRGPPGTHDVALGIATLEALRAGQPVRLPRFDKATDEPLPYADWPLVDRACDVILFEGWCVGARPQPPAMLTAPVNALERGEDPDSIWRGHINACLAGTYQALFAQVDRLVLVRAPSFDAVFNWRTEQEAPLIAANAPAAMDNAALARFIQHFERITTYCGLEMANRADLVVNLDAARNVTGHAPRACG